MQTARDYSRPIALSASTLSQTYMLFALAMFLTVMGVFLGMTFAPVLLTSGLHFFFLIAELAIVFSAAWWMDRSPLNMILFGAFPILSGLTFTPYIAYVLIGYANGAAILTNALLATTFMALAAAVFARIAPSLAGIGQVLFLAVIGLVFFSIAQIFIPSLRTGTAELMISGIGIVVFALFLALDLQRTSHLAKLGASPFLLALHLYLDIFNLLLYVLRFMIALSGERR